MASYCKVIMIGNITRDLELRDMPSGSKVLDFGIAINRKWKSKDGVDGEETTFVDVSAFGRKAEVIAQYHSKGDSIMIEGRLKLDQWESKDGQKRSKLSVVADTFEFQNSGKADKGGATSTPTNDPNDPPF